MSGRTDSRRRLVFLLLVLVLCSVSLVGRLAWWQVAQREDLASLAVAQTQTSLEVQSDRGTIYDRSGTVVLATTVDRWKIAAAPDQLDPTQQTSVAAKLATILGLDQAATADLTGKMTSNKPYIVVATDVPESTAGQIREGLADGSLAGISLEAQPVRVYPQAGGAKGTTLAAQLLGFVNTDGVGQYGVEQRYQDVLAGSPERAIADRSASTGTLAGTEQVLQAGSPGEDLRLTIDASLQLAVEQELFAAWVADRAKSVSAVIMDPYSGAVLAEASYPSYDANDYQALYSTDPSRFMDPVVSSVYEPGSVFKMLTATAALTNHVVTPRTIINDSGTMTLDGGHSKISDADRRPMGMIPFEDVVAYSRNVGAARVAIELGKTTTAAATVLHDTWLRLGFGAPTGIDVAGEVGGIVRDPAINAWRQIDLANGSFGQGVAVTPIQLATAYAAMANGGELVQPHVVAAIGNEDLSPAPRGRVVDPAVSAQLVGLMKHVVTTVPFYRDRTLVPGYIVGGKTGTAQIWDSRTHDWKVDVFNYSFVGFIGRSKPDLVIAVRIAEGTPTIVKVGEIEMPVMSFELFRRIATDAMSTLDLPSQIVTATASR